MNEDIKVNLIISAIICALVSIVLFFAYKGYYPFNTGSGKEFHYWVYDNCHIAFNHHNYKFDNKYYWCYESLKKQRNSEYSEKLQIYDEYINKIQFAIKNSYTDKYNNQFQIKNDISRIEMTYRHIDLYGSNQLKRQQEILDRKVKYNEKLDESIKDLEKLKEELQSRKASEIRQMLKSYCVEVLSN